MLATLTASEALTQIPPTAETKTALLKDIDAVVTADLDVKKYADLRQNAKNSGNESAELYYWDMKTAAEKTERQLFDDLVEQTEKVYGIEPPMGDRVQAPHDIDGRGAWSEGLQTAWHPVLLDDSNKIRAVTGADHIEHFVGGFPLSAFKGHSGLTLVDGTVLINPQRLAEALQDQNPGVLASTLRHEAQHFSDLTTRGYSSQEIDEYRAYTNDLAWADFFQLSPTRIKALRDQQEANKAAMAADKLKSYFPTPAQEGLLKSVLAADTQKQQDLSQEYEKLRADVAESVRQEQASDDNLRAALHDLAIKICTTPDVDQADLDALPQPRPGFSLGPAPSDLVGTCPEGIYLKMGWTLMRGHKLDLEKFRTRTSPVLPPLPPPPPSLPPTPESPSLAPQPYPTIVTPLQGGFEMAGLAKKACADPAGVTAEDLRAVNMWFPNPNNIASATSEMGLSGCSYDLYMKFLEVNNNSQHMDAAWVSYAAQFYVQKYATPPPPPPAPVPIHPRPHRDPPDPPPHHDPCWYEPGVGRVCEEGG